MVGRTLLAKGYLGAVLLYLYAPVAVIVLFSFADSPRLSMPIEGLSLRWYAAAFDNPLLIAALHNTLVLALITAVVTSAIGAAFAYGLVKLKRPKLQSGLLAASLLPAVVPLLVLGIALAVFFNALGSPQGLVNAAMGHVIVCLPFVILTMHARLDRFDFTVLEAARDLGASPLRAFRDITFPLIRPSILGAALLAAALSLDEFIVTWFNIGNEQTLPVLVWGLMRRGVDPSINALASLLLFALVCLVVVATLSGGRRRT